MVWDKQQPCRYGVGRAASGVGMVWDEQQQCRHGVGTSSSPIVEVGKETLPSWLHWQDDSLEGLPLDSDKGVYDISVTTFLLAPNGSFVPTSLRCLLLHRSSP
ncbi:unnamed protein product [Ranitomeya imitator]|uniref:Uncharacterized protein n=1 Tax=Ranitomeya imitator TaxID=111125 RepID=A0ABN9M1W0_9NEOB|nr:unnamed protein product [Ranitomeya imitator]